MPIPPDILELIQQGESESLEFKTRVREPLLLARLIAGFANNSGGRILVGVKEPPEVVGVDRSEFSKVYEAAKRFIEPGVDVSLSFVGEAPGEVAVVQIQKSSTVVYVQGGAFVRVGEMTRPMEWTQMLTRLPPKTPQANVETLLQESQKQTALLEKLLTDNEQLKEANDYLKTQVAELNDPAVQRRERWIGGAIGVGASLLAAFIWLLATKQITWLKS